MIEDGINSMPTFDRFNLKTFKQKKVSQSEKQKNVKIFKLTGNKKTSQNVSF